MDTVTYPDPQVAALITGSFVPVKLTVKEHPELVHEFVVTWTPHVVLLDGEGRLIQRLEGWFTPQVLHAQLGLGLGKGELAAERYDEAAARFEAVVAQHPHTESAAEALYWLGAARYRRSHEPADLLTEWKRLQAEAPYSPWADRSRVPAVKTSTRPEQRNA
jgi:thioredoxin-like negative regulator of GroEL